VSDFVEWTLAHVENVVEAVVEQALFKDGNVKWADT
jgi:hypothetical protein